MGFTVNFHVEANVTSFHSKFEIHSVMTEQLFNALQAIESLASGTMKVYGLPSARAWTAGMIFQYPFQWGILP